MRRFRNSLRLCSLVLLCCLPTLVAAESSRHGHSPSEAHDGTAPAAPAPNPVPQSPVTLDGNTLFSVPGVLSFPADARAEAITSRIQKLAKDVTFDPRALTTQDSGDTTDIMAKDLVLMSVTNQDAALVNDPRQQLAAGYAKSIADAIVAVRQRYSTRSVLIGAGYSLAATLVLLLILRLFQIFFPRLKERLHAWRLPAFRIQRFELLPVARVRSALLGLVSFVRLVLVLNLLYFYAYLLLGFFPWTQVYAERLLSYVFSPLRSMAVAAIDYAPNLVFIAVAIFIVYWIAKFIGILFREIAAGSIVLPGFYPEWADPTYKLVRLLLLALTLIVIFPYLPGAKSPAFQGISVFLGVLISFGSSSAVANFIAGTILTYMRPFRIGDRVQIGDTEGDVVEKTLLVTRIRTIKNVEVTLASSTVLGSHIVNYSAAAKTEGLILHTAVTIGYDAPWRTVHQLLIAAASATANIQSTPAPFVLQRALDDFFVEYQINAYTQDPHIMAQTYSALHQNIQDTFNEAGVEIMSSHYMSVRDGNTTTIPEAHRGSHYRAPAFRVATPDPHGPHS